MKVNNEELSRYVKSVVDGIKESIPEGFALNDTIRFQIGLSNVSDKQGNLTLVVAGIGGSKRHEENARVEFELITNQAQGERMADRLAQRR